MGFFENLKERRRRTKREKKSSVLDLFLKIEGIEGEAEDKAHAKELQVLDFFFYATNRGASATGKGGGKVEFEDVGFVVELDKSIIGCLQAGASGKHIKSAVLTARKAGGGQQDFLKWTFSDFIISFVQVQDSGYGSPVLAYLSLNFTKVQVEYKEQKADGSVGAGVSTGFDLATREKI